MVIEPGDYFKITRGPEKISMFKSMYDSEKDYDQTYRNCVFRCMVADATNMVCLLIWSPFYGKLKYPTKLYFDTKEYEIEAILDEIVSAL